MSLRIHNAPGEDAPLTRAFRGGRNARPSIFLPRASACFASGSELAPDPRATRLADQVIGYAGTDDAVMGQRRLGGRVGRGIRQRHLEDGQDRPPRQAHDGFCHAPQEGRG